MKRAKRQRSGTPADLAPETIAVARARLDAEVEKIKARRKRAGKEVAEESDMARVKTVGEIIRERFGLLDIESIEETEERLAKLSRLEQQELERRRWDIAFKRVVPPLFREPFSLSKVATGVEREGINRVLGWKFGPRGIYLIGDTGRAKSRAIYALARRLIAEEHRDVLAFDGVGFSNACSMAFSDCSQTERWISGCVRAEILLIDDLSKRLTPAAQQGAFAVFDRRAASMKPILATTNDSSDNLRAKITDPNIAEPLIRRLKEHSELVIF